MNANKHKSALDLFLLSLKRQIVELKEEKSEFDLIATMSITDEKHPLFKKGLIEIWKTSKSSVERVVIIQKTGRIETIDALEDFRDTLLKEAFSELIKFFEHYEVIQV